MVSTVSAQNIVDITADECDDIVNFQSIAVSSSQTTYYQIEFSDLTMSSDPQMDCAPTTLSDAWVTVFFPSSVEGIMLKTVGGGGIISSAEVYSLNSTGGSGLDLTSCGIKEEFFCSGPENELIINGIGTTFALVRIYASQSSNLWIYPTNTAPHPSNDFCEDATSVVFDNHGNFDLSFDSERALYSGVEAPSCADYPPYDTWYTFTSNASGTFELENNSNIGLPRYAVYEGDCSNLVEVDCGTVIDEQITVTPNTDIFVRVFNLGQNTHSMYDVEIKNTEVAVVDNDCATATPLTVGSEFDCSAEVISHLGFATSSGAIDPSCGPADALDVWYSFVAPTAGQVVVSTDAGSSYGADRFYAIYTNTCASLTEVACVDFDDEGVKVIDNLVAGQTYYYRLFGIEKPTLVTTCITEYNGASLNGTCAAAEEVFIPASGCSTTITANTVSGQDSEDIGALCTVNTGDKSLWYKFEAPESRGVEIDFSNTSNNFGSKVSIFTNNCSDLHPITECRALSDASDISVMGLVAGETYWIEIKSNSGAGFDLCISEITSSSDHAYCHDPDDLGVLPIDGGCSTPITLDMGQNEVDDVYSCGFLNQFSYFYSFTTTTSGSIVLGVTQGDFTTSLAILSDCGQTVDHCVSQSDGIVLVEDLGLGTFTLRVSTGGASSVGFCLFELESPPPNDECIDFTELSISDQTCNNAISSTTYGASDHDVFFGFESPVTQSYTISISDHSFDHEISILEECDGAVKTTGTNQVSLILNEGEVSLIRVAGASVLETSDFDICIKSFEVDPLEIDGKVGVGTEAPVQKFHLNGGIAIGDTDVDYPGTLRFDGQDIQGFTSQGWQSLTGTPDGSVPGETTEHLNMNNFRVTNLGSPIVAGDAATRQYVDNHTDADASSFNELQELSLNGQSLSLSMGGGSINLPTSVGDWNTLSNIPPEFADGIDNVNDGDIDINNERISDVYLTNTTMTIEEDDSTINLDLAPIASKWSPIATDQIHYSGGNVGIGVSSSINDRLHIRSAIGENALRVQVGTETKLRVRSNGGIVLGSNNSGVTDNNVYVANRLGIGVPAPIVELDIDGRSIISTNSANGNAQLTLNQTDSGFARLYMSNTTGKRWVVAADPDTTAADARLNFFLDDVGNIMTLRGERRVGIFDSTPAATIESNSATGDDPMILRTESTNHFQVKNNGHLLLGPGVNDVTNRWINTSTGAYLSTGGTWTNASSRSLKTNFAPVSNAAILSKLATLNILKWNYKADSSVTHLGPIAEDFRATFGLGHDSTSISTVDADGVALAAIQALYTENLELQEEVEQQRVLLEKLLQRVTRLEAQE